MGLLPADPVRRGRIKLLALAGIFSLPVVLGWIAFVFDLVPGATGNYGELIAPRPLEGADMEKKPRPKCLKCDRPFMSTHKFNRLCARCNKQNQRERTREIYRAPRREVE